MDLYLYMRKRTIICSWNLPCLNISVTAHKLRLYLLVVRFNSKASFNYSILCKTVCVADDVYTLCPINFLITVVVQSSHISNTKYAQVLISILLRVWQHLYHLRAKYILSPFLCSLLPTLPAHLFSIYFDKSCVQYLIGWY